MKHEYKWTDSTSPVYAYLMYFVPRVLTNGNICLGNILTKENIFPFSYKKFAQRYVV